MNKKRQRKIAENLFSELHQTPVLLGSLCGACDEHFFPRQDACAKCPSEDMQDVVLGSSGQLWSWTVQHFPPKPPFRSNASAEKFEAYGVGYIELPCGLKVESRLLENNPENLSIGDSMELKIVPFFTDEDGCEVLSFAFQRAS